MVRTYISLQGEVSTIAVATRAEDSVPMPTSLCLSRSVVFCLVRGRHVCILHLYVHIHICDVWLCKIAYSESE